MRRAPATGRVEPVDHQRLRRENLGPYVCATRPRLGTPKMEVARAELEPAFTVMPRAERFRLAAEGMTSQLVIKHRDDSGMCLIGALTDPADTDAELAELVAATGLSVERLRDFESQITEHDIAAAPPTSDRDLKP